MKLFSMWATKIKPVCAFYICTYYILLVTAVNFELTLCPKFTHSTPKTEYILPPLLKFQNFSLKLKKKFKVYGPFLWMGFNCLKATATSRRQFTFYHSVPRNSRYSFYDLVRMKGWVDLGATQWFWTRNPWTGNLAP